jgi:hypothetical protein
MSRSPRPTPAWLRDAPRAYGAVAHLQPVCDDVRQRDGHFENGRGGTGDDFGGDAVLV